MLLSSFAPAKGDLNPNRQIPLGEPAVNRTLALSSIFLVAVGGAVAARHAAAQGLSDAPPADRSGGAFADDLDAGAQPASGALPVDAAKEQYQKAVRHASDVLTGLLIQHSKDAP